VADNLLDRPFEPAAANPVGGADLPTMPTWEGELELAGVEELYAWPIVSGSRRERISRRRVVGALARAVSRRLPGEGLWAPAEGGRPSAREQCQRLWEQHSLPCRRSRRGAGWDNAARESFFASWKQAWVPPADNQSGAEAWARVFEYLAVFCNRVRRPWALGYLSAVA
jgi:putative transposase